ncbi:peptide-methionine (S)-S-oxide reductase MsrA [Alteribacillus bidgolensis]|uniref:Peptide methionine sulfoxide reductase MsrA n=1 Tax=Alteribacillus bidgolensis TaxID=930129 RepID=A0A1G8L8X0_9BACI|nr:peptide-methionine (S)-S-oxide reductase MsrA [Alteribacillus bidgolensis]SDI52086.1 peptide-methionine (S)-S-oxide reductase/peptide methionine sulfoxide reductase msrA/msrB [Alteribacillus bidgolensis]
MAEQTKLATFAGGCFWCMVGPFEQFEGVLSITSGYTGGSTENPTYEEVCSNKTGHVEAVQIEYDPEKVSYRELLNTFWKQIDPTDRGGQFNDRGDSYQTAIFYHDEPQKLEAEQSRKELDKEGPFNNPIATPIIPAKTFYPAEEYHQDYHKKNQFHYLMYRKGSGREGFIKDYWGE